MDEILGLPLLLSLLVIAWSFLLYFCYVFWWKPESWRVKLREQGIKGPPTRNIIFGNIPEMKRMMSQISQAPEIDGHLSVFPCFKMWADNYGNLFTFALGKIQLLYVTNIEMVKEIRVFRSLELGKPAYLQEERGVLLGKGLITSNGLIWSHQRRTIAPQIYMDKVKDMLDLMLESGNALVKSWENIIATEGGASNIMIDDDIRNFTSQITSKMIFGSDHHKGIKIFPKCRDLIKAMGAATTLGLPFSRFIPTKSNREARRLAKEVHGIIMEIAKARAHSDTYHQDTLQVILEGSRNGSELGNLTKEEFIVDNCKAIVLASYEVNAIVATWALMLLASHPEWQDRARKEVLEVCGGQLPDYNMLSKMIVLKMVIQEVLRLYPVVAFVSREALQDVKLGDVQVPKGVGIWIWMLALHRDPKLWGPDADKFNPGRFDNGISAACKSSQAYIPFGLGARVCPGQNLAIVELKVLFAIILSNFKLTISPKYLHSPKIGLLLEPEHGVNLLVEKK